ncbi:HTH_Tnp_Tc3_2 domain-containing protein [Trichonephila clavipes]|nr:HTH_Tnp_Tc3_2 domain-containing protein [Trichonephila clavipes]
MRRGHNKEDQLEPEEAENISTTPTHRRAIKFSRSEDQKQNWSTTALPGEKRRSEREQQTVPISRVSSRKCQQQKIRIRNCWEQWTREGTHARKTGSGVIRKTTRREDRRIVRQALVDPTVTRSTIRADVGVAIVSQTISRHLAEANLKSKCPFRALPLTPEHRQLRLQ